MTKGAYKKCIGVPYNKLICFKWGFRILTFLSMSKYSHLSPVPYYSSKKYDAFYLIRPIISINVMYKSRKDPLINLFDIAIVISLGIITHHFSIARNIFFIYLLHCTGLHKAIFIQVYSLLYFHFLRFILTYVYMSLWVYAHMCANREV